MKKQTAANISLVLALTLWPMAFIGFSVLADEHEPSARGVLVAGISTTLTFVFLLSTAWLAGYSYTEAKKRATISTLSCVGYVLVLAWFIWK